VFRNQTATAVAFRWLTKAASLRISSRELKMTEVRVVAHVLRTLHSETVVVVGDCPTRAFSNATLEASPLLLVNSLVNGVATGVLNMGLVSFAYSLPLTGP
jgi:hypothetical protein